jgi:serine/threonine-protein kinase
LLQERLLKVSARRLKVQEPLLKEEMGCLSLQEAFLKIQEPRLKERMEHLKLQQALLKEEAALLKAQEPRLRVSVRRLKVQEALLKKRMGRLKLQAPLLEGSPTFLKGSARLLKFQARRGLVQEFEYNRSEIAVETRREDGSRRAPGSGSADETMEPRFDDTARPGRVGPYRLAEPIGSGGMGTVWRAWDERLKRQVAVKHIRADAQHEKLRERLWREAQTAARLNHSVIVHIYDLVEGPEGDWIVMELVEGKTVRTVIEETGRLPFAQAVELALDIAEGLAEAHSHGILHRDLKAANVMVTPAGHAKILDFGLAKQLLREEGGEDQEASLSTSGLIIGTPYAMSPEQVLGRPLDARSDLFSLGALLHEMVTGEPPFRAATSTASMASILNFQPPPLVEECPEVPKELSDLVGRLLQKDPRFRPQSAREVVKALAGLAGVSAPQDHSQPSTIAELALLVRGLPGGRPGSSSAERKTTRLWRRWGLGLVAVVLMLGAWLWPRFQAAPQPPPKPETYAVSVLVVDPQRRPVDATIHPPAGSMLRRLPDGWWEVSIPAGKVPVDGWISIQAEHDDWEANRRDLHLEEDPSPRVVIPLKAPESWLRGEVVDSKNRPVAGVRVSRLGAQEEAVTGPKGRFELELPVPPEKRVRLRTEHQGWAPGDDFCFSGRDTCYIVLYREER